MKTESKGKRPRARIWLLLSILAGAGLTWALFSQTQLLKGQANTPAPKPSPVFTPAHSSVSEAFRHFFGIRPKPQQPIAWTHTVHIHQAGLDGKCNYCHDGVDKGPIANIPGVSTCITCHDEDESAASPERMKIFEYQKKGEDIPWQRVYGWVEESHVKFNHAPHIRAKVECATCHGDVANMTVAEKVVDHTMGFCIKCHEQKKAPNDCMTCHY
jgi:cytochrome c7-like protein